MTTVDSLKQLGDLMIESRKIPAAFFENFNKLENFYVEKNKRSTYHGIDLVAVPLRKYVGGRIDESQLKTLEDIKKVHDSLFDSDNVVDIYYEFSRVGGCPEDPNTPPNADFIHEHIEKYTHSAEELFSDNPLYRGIVIYVGRRDIFGDELATKAIKNSVKDYEIYIEEKNIAINPSLISEEDAQELVNRFSKLIEEFNIMSSPVYS